MTDWLPPQLVLPARYDECIEFLVDRFRVLIVTPPRLHHGEHVHLNLNRLPDGRPEAFWHLCGRGDNRELDPKRAEKLPWLVPLLARGQDPNVRVWDGPGQRGRSTCRYVWLPDCDYLAVLARGRQGGWFLVTAHHVEGRRRRIDLRGRFESGTPVDLGQPLLPVSRPKKS